MKETKSQRARTTCQQEIKDYHTYLMFVKSIKIKALSVKRKGRFKNVPTLSTYPMSINPKCDEKWS
jgi:hypothetical protein